MDMKKIVNPWKGMAGYNCFGCAPDNPAGFHLEFFEDGDDIVTFWQPSAPYQGWEGIVHGGIQALLLDEVCGWVVTRKAQTAGVTMSMETRYLKPVSASNRRLTVRARIRERQRNILIIDAEILNDEGLRCTEKQVSICAKDSGGPYSYQVVGKLIDAAKRMGADYAVDVYPHYGSDVEVTLHAGHDIRHGLIGAGVYASHGYERSHIDGVYNTLKVLCGYLNV